MSAPPVDDVAWRLERAEGFRLLRMARAARAELEQLPADVADQRPVREAWLRQHMDEENWPQVVTLASALAAEQPRPEFAVWEAYARRRCESLAAARAVLEEARTRFPQVALIVFNLACYACAEGRLDDARSLLRDAMRGNHRLVELAEEDDDLAPLWPELDDLFERGAGSGPVE